MNKLTKLAAFTFIFVCLGLNSIAQEKRCITDEMVTKSLQAHPELLKEFILEQERLAAIDKAESKTGYAKGKELMPAPYTIPVVFHILHQGGPENISDAQVYDAIRVMNEDFAKTNADFINTLATFVPIAANSQFTFKLAQKDPSGNCTNGIDRINTPLTVLADDDSKLNPWPRNKYLNIWVALSLADVGAAAYAYFPGTAFPTTADGIISIHSYVGSIGTSAIGRSHTLSHETGHFLNLRHVWGNGALGTCSTGTGDAVADTPPTIGYTSCNLTGASCGSTLDNVQNFMDYSYCSTMFTAGQATRMQTAAASTTGQRSSLSTATNLTATGVSLPAVLCLANFQTNLSSNTICVGTSLTFEDLSWNGLPTSWNWTFPGGTPSSSSLAAPVITYSTPGIYDVSLSVSNTSGTVSATKTAYVMVNPATATYVTPMYSESFEGASIPNAEWQVINGNSGSNTWTQTTTAAATGSKCVRIVNASSYDGYVDELIGPSIDMTAITGSSAAITFKVAHAQSTSASNDKLQLYVSTNCGQTWTLRKNLQGASLSTAGIQSASFTPTAGQWVTQTSVLSGYATVTNLYYMFRFTSNAGNNIYLDDINILGTVGVDELSNAINFNVYPNPTEDNSIIAFELIEKEKVSIELFDVVGRLVSSVFTGELSAGEHSYPATIQSELAAGAYFVKLTAGNKSFTKKLIVN